MVDTSIGATIFVVTPSSIDLRVTWDCYVLVLKFGNIGGPRETVVSTWDTETHILGRYR